MTNSLTHDDASGRRQAAGTAEQEGPHCIAEPDMTVQRPERERGAEAEHPEDRHRPEHETGPPEETDEFLRATLRRMQRQTEAAGLLSSADSLASGDVEAFARRVTELAAQATGCERVNVWLFNDDESELHCIDLFELSSGRHSAGMVLNESEFHNEFEVLHKNRYVNADDPLTDPRTAGYVEGYLKPLGITSMLDAVIHSGGRNLGLLCLEHVDRPHHWEQDEIAFACRLADKIGLSILNRMRQQAESALRVSEGRVRAIFDSVYEAIFAHDPQTGAFIDVNIRATEMFGYSRDEILHGDVGMISSGVPPYTQTDALARMTATAYGEMPPFEWHFKSRDGRLFWGEVSLRRTMCSGQETMLAAVRDITWRKQAEQDLQFANTLLTTELEMSPDGILVVDQNGKVVLFNRRLLEMWRIPRTLIEERVDQPILAGVTAQVQDPEAFLTRVRYLYEHPDERGEEEILLKDGRIFERYSASLIPGPGEYLGRIWFFRDVTERRRSELALREERDFSAALIENLPAFFALIDGKGRLVRWNGNLAALLGLPEEQLQGFDAFSVASNVDRGILQKKMQAALEDHTTPQMAEFGIAMKSGEVRMVRWSGTGLTREGRPYLLVVGTDVTEERDAEMRLRMSEERFRAVSETAQDAIIMIDSSSRVTLWNPAAERILGYTASEAIGTNVHEWLTPARFRERVEAGMRQFGATGSGNIIGKTVEAGAIRKDGIEIPVEISVASIRLGREWHAVAILRDITERKCAEEQMRRMARHDILTGLSNRAVFVEALKEAISQAGREDTSFAVLYLDLDHFKDINDTLGHPVGDLLLQSVAQRLEEIIRKTDLAARFGGDEFALLQSNIHEPADAAILADKVLKALQEPFLIKDDIIRVGSSVGIAVYGPDSPDAEALLSHADVALYRAKLEGRGTYRFFTDSMDAEVRTRVKLGAELREAIASDQLTLFYQPQIDIGTGAISGIEALARWPHPTRGLISPCEFIPVAETSGLIVALGHWVLREACRQAKAWLDAGYAPPPIAVNISALQFKRPLELEHDIAGILEETALPPQLLELELTEGILMEAVHKDHDILRRLRTVGVHIAIDDFGTGYSSLEYLGRLPVDRIKIAQNFMRDLTTDSAHGAIVRAAIRLAEDLKLGVIVEGVETAEQLALIRSWGCRQVQGFFFSRPLPAQEITALLSSRKAFPVEPLIAEPNDAGAQANR
jgi:diguanylate cyclase (GGDEF)-like protein/PAS domain S-box-containing protein